MAGTHYVGKAGHLATMGEFALRGYNVAMPEIDVGDDVFVMNDKTGASYRIQVKTSVAKKNPRTASGQFEVREDAISSPSTPELHFVFVLRIDQGWRYVVIGRQTLWNYVKAQKMGSRRGSGSKTIIHFDISLHHSGANSGKALCSKIDVTHHLEDWDSIGPAL